MTRELEPINGRNLPHGFPDDVVTRALTLMMEIGSVRQALAILQREYDPCPAYPTLWMWAHESEQCLEAVRSDKKRDVIAIYADASMAFGERMVGVADRLPDSQVAVPAGIVTQRYTELVRPASGGNQLNVQFNLVTRDDA